jgi:uncharacterized membrane protein YfcA
MLGIIALALVSGLLIGCIGIGGVLLVPTLSLLDIDVHQAIGASMFSFIFSGAIGVWLYTREGSIDWASAVWLGGGATPGALAGSLISSHVNGSVLLVLVGAMVIFAGSQVWLRQASIQERPRRGLPQSMLLAIGIIVGLVSALTGTGGPVLLVPLLIWLGLPAIISVGLSQAIQVPIAAMASLGNLWTGDVDLVLGASLSIGIVIGSAIGARMAHALPTFVLARVVAVALMLTGLLLIVRSGRTLAGAW